MSVILDNLDRTTVIDLSNLPTTKHFRPALIEIKKYPGTTSDSISELDDAAFFGIKRSWGVNYTVDVSLTGKKYYSAFGPKDSPLVVSGIIVAPTCDMTGSDYDASTNPPTKYSTSPYRKFQTFADTYRTMDEDLQTDDLLSVYIDDPAGMLGTDTTNQHICALVGCDIQTSGAGKASSRIFNFQLMLEEMD